MRPTVAFVGLAPLLVVGGVLLATRGRGTGRLPDLPVSPGVPTPILPSAPGPEEDPRLTWNRLLGEGQGAVGAASRGMGYEGPLLDEGVYEARVAEARRLLAAAPETSEARAEAEVRLALRLLEAGSNTEGARTLLAAAARDPARFGRVDLAVAVAFLRDDRPDLAFDPARRAAEARPDLVARWILHLAGERSGRLAEVPPGFRVARPPGGAAPPGLAFTDMAPGVGLAQWNRGRGVGAADIDGDGRDDLVVAALGRSLVFYRNVTPPGGPLAFEEVTDAWGPEAPDTVPWGVALFDHDGDGDLDLYAPGFGYPWRLYRWDARPGGEGRTAGRYLDVTAEAGVDGKGADGWCATFADYDGDGDVDIYVPCMAWSGRPYPNVLYRNEGGGTFVDVAREAGVDSPWASFGAAFGDVDGDGDPDLLVANEGHPEGGSDGVPPHLYRNEGDGTYTDVARAAGVTRPTWGFPCFVADFTNDGRPDLYITGNEATMGRIVASWERGAPTDEAAVQRLYVNLGDGGFVALPPTAGLHQAWGTMGAAVGDVDNDGRLDIYLGNGGPAIDRLEPNALYRNEGDGRFTECARALGLDHVGKGHGVVFADLDNDGDLDLFHALGGASALDAWRNVLWRNDSTNGHHWFRIELRAPGPNTRAVGARVTVEAGGLLQVREVTVTEGFGCTTPYALHFGLGEAARVDRLVVRWPWGEEQVHEGLEVDRAWRLERGGSPRPVGGP